MYWIKWQVLELRLGDFVEVNLGAEDDETEDHFGVMQIVELFEDIQASLHTGIHFAKEQRMQCLWQDQQHPQNDTLHQMEVNNDISLTWIQ